MPRVSSTQLSLSSSAGWVGVLGEVEGVELVVEEDGLVVGSFELVEPELDAVGAVQVPLEELAPDGAVPVDEVLPVLADSSLFDAAAVDDSSSSLVEAERLSLEESVRALCDVEDSSPPIARRMPTVIRKPVRTAAIMIIVLFLYNGCCSIANI
jgi:hypothetical protein